jgi:hypothetical protein
MSALDSVGISKKAHMPEKLQDAFVLGENTSALNTEQLHIDA